MTEPTPADKQRGFDHGTFAPLAAIYPEGNVPVLQLSIRCDYDPEAHIAVGRALAPLRQEGVLMVGSGLSYHNLTMLGPLGQHSSHEFDTWLTEAVCGSTSQERNKKLRDWKSAPSARVAHPEEDHLRSSHRSEISRDLIRVCGSALKSIVSSARIGESIK